MTRNAAEATDHGTAIDTGLNRPTDPNVLQRRASNPKESVWAAASAGTGKTKVLTDRVLRLLLPREDTPRGTPPQKILCLTFTKAGASEMALRIARELGKWAVMPEEELKQSLARLLGQDASSEALTAARRLFARVIDAPGGLKIMTIHSFCQSVLGRFPLEAGLVPGFTPLEEAEGQALLLRARNGVLERARRDKSSPEGQALDNIAAIRNEDQFMTLLRNLCSERADLERHLRFGVEGLYTKICETLKIVPGHTPDDILLEACQNDAFDLISLRTCCAALATGTVKTDAPKAIALQDWLDSPPERRAARWERYCDLYLTEKSEIRKKIATKSVQESHPACEPALIREAGRLQKAGDTMNAARCALLTRDLFLLGHAIIKDYQGLKESTGALDFDDLIVKTLDLLQGRTMDFETGIRPAQWILHKLDEGIDHFLIDEAQDTNPQQWDIVRILCEEFFTGDGARETTRTLFTVGDEKQSIFSFQRAAPEKFRRMQGYFREKVTYAGQGWQDIPLNISFRSCKAVLQLVDEVFADPVIREGLGQEPPRHEAFRRGQAGLAELWPLCAPDENAAPKPDPWEPPVTVRESATPASRLAVLIAEKIAAWVGREELPSHGRPVEAGDIMILMRTRSAFVGQLMRELRNRNIPVAGADRMVLNNQLAVQDLMALAGFALLPEDDLTLACILKSPLIGWTDDDLLRIAPERKSSLWEALRQDAPRDLLLWLEALIESAGKDRPYEFFSRILQQGCPADPVSGLRAIRARLGDDTIDPIDEFLNAALDFEQMNLPSLQHFVHTQAHGSSDVKREMEEAGGRVRIMTVHGSKGLQAPIVILPDTVRTAASKKTPRLIWPDKSGLPVPLWSPRKDTDCAVYADAFANVGQRLDEEYRRLLYVAMTRAEDRLYVAGYSKGKNAVPGWYDAIAAAFERCPDAIRDGDVLRLSCPQTERPDRAAKTDERRKEQKDEITAGWLHAKAPPESVPAARLIPSQEGQASPPARSPLSAPDEHRFMRGVVTHKLLQLLPDIDPSRRNAAAQNYVAQPGHGLPETIQANIVAETMAILEHPDFCALFAPGSMAEVPVSGVNSDGRIIAGQIDRLVVREHDILIVDYKTNRPPPSDPRNVPQQYRRQLRAYADIIRGIYPGKPVRMVLLWTDGPRIMEIGTG